MFAYDSWYVAAFGYEITRRIFARRILNQPLVMFRTMDGKAVALEDRCCHRALPLSLGEIVGDTIRCNYHGLTFSSTGKCVHIPSQDAIPEAAKVRAYPLVERGLALWIWLGDPAKADESLIPAYPWHDDPEWAWKAENFPISCGHALLSDNLLDLTHLAYVHRHTIGGDPRTHFETETKMHRTERGLKLTRWMPNSNPPPTYTSMVSFAGKVDRWQEVEYLPGLVSIYSGAVDATDKGWDGPRVGGFQLRLFDAITPETETSTHNFFAAGHNFRVNEPHITHLLFEDLRKTVAEDVVVLNAQQARISETKDRPFVDIKQDAAGLQARRIMLRLQEGDTAAR